MQLKSRRFLVGGYNRLYKLRLAYETKMFAYILRNFCMYGEISSFWHGLVKIPRMCLSTGYFFWGGIFAFVGAVCPGVIFT